MANGWNSREKTRLPVKRLSHVTRQEESSAAVRTLAQSDEENADAKDLASSAHVVQIDGPKRSIVRSGNFIFPSNFHMRRKLRLCDANLCEVFHFLFNAFFFHQRWYLLLDAWLIVSRTPSYSI